MSESVACPCDGGHAGSADPARDPVVLADGPLHGYRLAERIGACPASPARSRTSRASTAF